VWPASEVDLTTGCNARRANWPAQIHWIRIRKLNVTGCHPCDPDLRATLLVTMAAAYHGGIPIPDGDAYVNDPTVLDALGRAMDYWFTNDYTNDACLEYGGLAQCPCGTPGLWNTNWFSNVSSTPSLIPSYNSI